MKEFTVTEDHLKLLDRICFGYDDWTEFGAPEVDPKRPYGNSSVYEDIAEILSIEPEENDGYSYTTFSPAQKDYMLKVHKEMQFVLQILVNNRGITTGNYVSNNYGLDWTKV